MNAIIRSSFLKTIITNRPTSSLLIVALWLCGMAAASIPVILLAGFLALIWPQICLFWYKIYRAA